MSQSLVRTKLTPAETAAIRMVLDGLPSEHSRRAYERALMDFFLLTNSRQSLVDALRRHPGPT